MEKPIGPTQRILDLAAAMDIPENNTETDTCLTEYGGHLVFLDIPVSFVEKHLPPGLTADQLILANEFVQELKSAATIATSEHVILSEVLSKAMKDKKQNTSQAVMHVHLGGGMVITGYSAFLGDKYEGKPRLTGEGNEDTFSVRQVEEASIYDPRSTHTAWHYANRNFQEAMAKVCSE